MLIASKDSFIFFSWIARMWVFRFQFSGAEWMFNIGVSCYRGGWQSLSGDDFVACYRSQEQPGARRWHVTSCRTKPKVETKNIQIIINIIFTVFRRGHQLVPGSGRAVWGELMVRCPAPAPPPRARGAAAPPLVWATGPPAGMGAGPGGRGRNLHTPSPPSCVPSSRTQASRQTTRHPTSRNPRVFAPLCSAR